MKNKILSSLIVVVALLVTKVQSQCAIQTDLDFGDDSPLLYINTNYLYADRCTPQTLSFAANQPQMAYCPGTTMKIPGQISDDNSVILSCSSGSRFRAPNIDHEFHNIRCNRPPVPITRNLGSCPSGTTVEIGFQLTNQLFARTIDLCFNYGRSQATWAHIMIPGPIDGRQTIRQSPNYRLVGYYPYISVVRAYTRESQRQIISKIFNHDESLVDRYIPITGNHYLAKGHLIDPMDHYYTAIQNATFYYINVLPIWQSVNIGNWLIVKNTVRSFPSKRGNIDVLTGSIYDLELSYKPNEKRVVYLANHSVTDQPALIVPRLLFRTAYDGASNQAMVYITVNNPHLESTNPLPKEYQACAEYLACRQNEPLFNNVDRGFTYCCLWSDFIKNGYVAGLGLPNYGNPGPLQ